MRLNSLIANLPFNPSLVSQVSFYAVRLHQEASIRRLGLLMTCLAMVVQLFAVFAPATPSAASANVNDIVHGGGDKTSLIGAILNNSDGLGRRDIRPIFEYYLGSAGAAEAAIAGGTEETITASAASDYWSIGRTRRDSGDQAVAIPGTATPIYQRSLAGWGDGLEWQVIRVKSAVTGQDMWIMKDCGNIVTKGPFERGTPAPLFDKNAEPAAGSHVAPGQRITYRLLAGNAGPGNMLGTTVQDRVPTGTSLETGSISGAAMRADVYADNVSSAIVRWVPDNVSQLWGASPARHELSFSVIVDAGLADGTRICNDGASMFWIDKGVAAGTVLGYEVCHIVATVRCVHDAALPADSPLCKERCEYDAKLFADDADCRARCPYDASIYDNNPACQAPAPTARCIRLTDVTPVGGRLDRTFTVEGSAEHGARLTEYRFDYDGNGSVDYVLPATGIGPMTFRYSFPDTPRVYQSRIRVGATSGNQGVETPVTASAACALTIDIPAPPPAPQQPLITESKRVRNVTRKLDDADGSTARGGDTLEYSLVTRNAGDGTKTQHPLRSEDLADVLEYADVVSLDDGSLNTATKVVTWPEITLHPGEAVTKTVTVRIKDPIPATPVAASLPQSFDLKMQNHYGNAVTVNLAQPVPKQIENVGKSLPATGPGLGVALMFLTTSVVAYFFMRSRILAKELDMIRVEYASGGGL